MFALASQLPAPGRTRGRILLLAGALALVLLMLGANAQRAEALCSGHAPEHGTWTNASPSTAGIARIQLADCQPVTTCSGNICSTTHDAGWRMRVWGKCSPTNCDWGWSAGAFPVSGMAFGFYDQGFAKRRVYAKMSAYRPGQLWVQWQTDFVDPSRADYTKDEWFVRV